MNADRFINPADIDTAAVGLLAWALRMDTDCGRALGSADDAARRVLRHEAIFAPWQVEVARLILSAETGNRAQRAAVRWEAAARAATRFIIEAADALDDEGGEP